MYQEQQFCLETNVSKFEKKRSKSYEDIPRSAIESTTLTNLGSWEEAAIQTAKLVLRWTENE